MKWYICFWKMNREARYLNLVSKSTSTYIYVERFYSIDNTEVIMSHFNKLQYSLIEETIFEKGLKLMKLLGAKYEC